MADIDDLTRDELIELNLSDFSSTSIDVDGIQPNAIDFRGGSLRGNDRTEPNLYVIDPSSGDASVPSNDIGESISAIVSDGGLLWCVSRVDRQIYLYNYVLDISIQSIPYGNVGTAGGTYVDGSLFLIAAGVVTEFEVTMVGFSRQIEAVGAFQLPGYDIVGIAHDGDDFWVNAREIGVSGMKIRRIRPRVAREGC